MNSLYSAPVARALLAVCGVCWAVTTQASGFRMTHMSATGLGMGGAMVANADEPGAFAYNPAALSFHEGSIVMAGVVIIDNALTVLPAGGSGEVGSTHDNPAYLPVISLAHRVSPAIAVGLNVNSPFGLAIEWPAGTFPVLSNDFTRAAHPAESSIALVNFNPNVSYRVNARTSLALGADYYWIKQVKLDTETTTMEGDGGDIGWNAGLLYDSGSWSAGVSYRSAVTVGVSGEMASPDFSNAVSADVPLPWLLQLGARYRFTEKLSMEFDYERTGWKKFSTMVVNGAPGGPVVITNNWKNADAYHVGLTYEFNPAVRLHGGYVLDINGQPDDRFSARAPDANRQLFSLGLGHRFGKGWTWEGAYGYVKSSKRTVGSNVPFGAYGGDPNGTSAYNGVYDASAHIFALSMTKVF